MIAADMVWPAIYIAGSLLQFWFLVFLTIAVEAVCIKYFLKTTFGKAILISTIGNLISGLIGTYFMSFFTLITDGVTGLVFKQYGFSMINWLIDYLFMCFGSILIEILVIKLIWSFEFKKLLLPLSAGNVLSYILIIVFNNFNLFYTGID